MPGRYPGRQPVMLQQVLEKCLDGILGVSRCVPPAPDEGVERRPIGFGKRGERLTRRFFCLGPARLQHHGPMRRLERRTTFLQRPWNRFR